VQRTEALRKTKCISTLFKSGIRNQEWGTGNCIKVRDITRRRGIGRYLSQQTEKFIQANVYNSVKLSPMCQIEDNSILELFLQNSGYKKIESNPTNFEKSLN
jgi:hypothetical protein